MKKQELLNILNESADSINLHDGSLTTMRRDGDRLTFFICIGEYHYLINDLDSYVDNIKDWLVLSLTFTGVKNLEMDSAEEFQFDESETCYNESIDNTYMLMLLDVDISCEITFSYEGFSWDVIKELSSDKYEEWRDDFVKKL